MIIVTVLLLFLCLLRPTMPSITLVWEAGVACAAAQTPFLDIERAVTRIIRESNQSNNQIQVHKIIQLPNKGIKIFTETENCIQNLQNDSNKLKLSERIGLSFQPSLERLAGCTLVIRPHNTSAFDDADDVILAAVRRAAGAPADEPISIWKSQDKKTVKLIFQHRTYAETVQTNGFGVGGFYFSKYRIRFGEYFHINQCMKCFEFETHTTRNCQSTILLCSECGSEGHIWRHCPQPSPPRCINCRKRGQDDHHRTLGNSCPLKKELIRKKRNEKYHQEKQKQHLPVIHAVTNTIASMMNQAPPPSVAANPNVWPRLDTQVAPVAPPPAHNPAPAPEKKKINKNEITLDQQIKTITLLAHQHNAAFPGTFNEKLNYLLARNKIATVDVGEDWPSGQILRAIGAQSLAADADEDNLLMDEDTVLRESSPTIAPSIFPSYWPEHELEFSCSSISSPASPRKKKKKKRKKNTKLQETIEISTDEEEEKKKEETPKPTKNSALTITIPQPPWPKIKCHIRPEGGVVLPNGDIVTKLAASRSEGWSITSAEPVGPGQNLDFCRGAIYVSFRRGVEECATYIPYDFKYEMQYSTTQVNHFYC